MEKMREQLIKWLEEISRWNAVKDFIRWEDKVPEDEWLGCIFYTHTNKYHISVRNRKDHTYLGCTVSTRKPRAGEDWTRGNDLHDGPFNQKTWEGIKNDIIAYELVKVAKPIKRGEDKMPPTGPDKT